MKNWKEQIDENTEAFNRHFGSLASEQLNWKPNPNSWSIGQNIDHLIKINQSYFPVFSSVREGTYSLPMMGKLGFMVSFLGKTILNSVQPDRKKRMNTFTIWEPSSSDISANILEQFQQHQVELAHQMESCKDLVDKGAVISSPANRYIVYKLETAFEIIITHEKRHLAQAKEVLEQLNLNLAESTK